ncbi:MAG: hypothetical protein WDW38_008355 [Sanguina aurantia]
MSTTAAAPTPYQLPQAQTLVMEVAGKQITLETGEIGRQANAAIMATMGETTIYTTACCSPVATGDGSFLPLTVNYAERFSAAGRTSGGFVKRDGRPRDSEVLVSRLVDRPLRPMFAEGWANETQVLQWVMSYDGVNSADALAITAAAAALLISDIPMNKAVAGVRVGLLSKGGGFIINPTVQEMALSKLDLVMAGTSDAILMIEGFCDFLTEEQMLLAIAAGHAAIQSMCQQMTDWAAVVGRRKRRDVVTQVPAELAVKVKALVGAELLRAYSGELNKSIRGGATQAAKARVLKALLPAKAGGGSPPGGPAPEAASSPSPSGEAAASYTEVQLGAALKALESDIMRNLVLDHGQRGDGRGVTDIRPISSRAALLPRTHGSCLFTRGETQAICVTTIGSKMDAMKTDSMRGESSPEEGRFYLHYHFPPSSVGEIGKTGMAGRRELGHGELAQRALMPSLPAHSSFPYTVRIESTITESNGSSSMASVCGGSLSLMDAGVPIKRPIAGIAMGLILEPDGRFAVLSDILGSEDALGDMDFKVAGDNDSVTAFQMDIKVRRRTVTTMRQALLQARTGRQHILREMTKCSPAPRKEMSSLAPRILRLQIDPLKKAGLVGVGGRTLKQIMEVSAAIDITVDDDGTLEVCAPSAESAAKAMECINLVLFDPANGTIFRKCKVVALSLYGAFVEISPGRQGLIHVSELDLIPTAEVSKVLSINDLVDVQVIETGNGKLSLSRKAVMIKDGGKAYSPPESASKGFSPAPSPLMAPSFVTMGGRGGQGVGPGGGRGGRGGGVRRP